MEVIKKKEIINIPALTRSMIKNRMWIESLVSQLSAINKMLLKIIAASSPHSDWKKLSSSCIKTIIVSLNTNNC